MLHSGTDYHWYRQDSNGYWSHKQGLTDVKNTDNSGNLIIDPRTADLGDYDDYIGFFCVTPWSNLYTPSDTTSRSMNDDNVSINIKSHGSKLVPVETILRIQTSMTLEETIDLIGYIGKDIGNGAIIYQYNVTNGCEATIFFAQNDEGIYLVSKIILE